MTTLDTYLSGPHRKDTELRQLLIKTIDEVIPIFYKRKQDVSPTTPATVAWSTWPYAVKANHASGGAAVGGFSASTHGMILFALDSFAPRKPDQSSFLLGPGFRPCKLDGGLTSKKELAALVKSAQDYLVVEVAKWDAGAPVVTSGTYGNNDPFTLTWLVELAFRLLRPAATPDSTLERIVKAADAALTRQAILDTPATTNRFSEVTGSFLKVRRLHLALATKRLADELGASVAEARWPQRPALWTEFDSTLHRQLSYHAMGDPKFDPAELAFAFEGALLLEPNWVGRAVGEQVFAALALNAAGQPFWRPVTPFLANDRGQVLFLVSVEVANSILRSCELLDRRNLVPEAFARIESHLRTYATWLLGEAERVQDSATKGKLVGWRFEYGEERGLIHLWHTSHVLLFLAHYECFLKRKIAADGVEAAGLSVGFPKNPPISNFWVNDEPLPGVSAAGGPYAVFDRLRRHYVEPRTAGREPGVHSLLVYGPPGTGKTTVAEQMAHSLGLPLVTLTVSDFLAAGSAELENRAKGVFKVLRSQEGVVILFDEIDQFLLDRNSEFYREQSDVFKFMTPGMLNKFQDLRDDRDCVFIIATNYFERIDSAIKRRGRVDDHLLLSLPNKARRAAMLRKFVGKALPALVLPADFAALAGAADVLARTVFFGWGDLKYLVESTAVAIPGLTKATLCGALATAADGIQPAVNLPAYSVRFEGRGPYPFEEFFLMAYLMVESGQKFSQSDQDVIQKAVSVLKLTKGNYDHLLGRHVKDKVVSDALKPPLLPLLP